MRPAIITAALGLVVVAAGVWFLRSGLMNFSATVEPSAIEERVASMALDASIARHAPRGANPVPSTPPNLVAGAQLYTANCSVCHGSPMQPISQLLLYPRAPQFFTEAPDMPPGESFFTIKGGIRWTGMPAWKDALTDEQIWTVVAFLGQVASQSPAAQQDSAAPGR